MRRSLRVAVIALLTVVPGIAIAAPIARPADVTMTITQSGYFFFFERGSYSLVPPPTATGSGSVRVDAIARSISLPAGLLALAEPYTAVVDATSAVNSWRMTRLSNLSATFSIGGAGGIAGEPPCPSGPGFVCVPQTGLGGRMALIGTLYVDIVPGVITLPLNFSGIGAGLGGPVTMPTFTGDPAPWTIGTPDLLSPTPFGTDLTVRGDPFRGGTSGSTLRLVSPIYFTAVGNVLPVLATLEITFTDGLGLPDFVLDEVPEPAVWLLAAAAALGLGWRQRRRYSGGV